MGEGGLAILEVRTDTSLQIVSGSMVDCPSRKVQKTSSESANEFHERHNEYQP
jgi:hypothetical protein